MSKTNTISKYNAACLWIVNIGDWKYSETRTGTKNTGTLEETSWFSLIAETIKLVYRHGPTHLVWLCTSFPPGLHSFYFKLFFNSLMILSRVIWESLIHQIPQTHPVHQWPGVCCRSQALLELFKEEQLQSLRMWLSRLVVFLWTSGR